MLLLPGSVDLLWWWSYPILFIFGKLGILTYDGEAIVYCINDMLAKVTFGLILVGSREALEGDNTPVALLAMSMIGIDPMQRRGSVDITAMQEIRATHQDSSSSLGATGDLGSSSAGVTAVHALGDDDLPPSDEDCDGDLGGGTGMGGGCALVKKAPARVVAVRDGAKRGRAARGGSVRGSAQPQASDDVSVLLALLQSSPALMAHITSGSLSHGNGRTAAPSSAGFS